MGVHESYAAELLRRVLGLRFKVDARAHVKLQEITIKLDGIITKRDSHDAEWAVEIEAENEPQVRGAILNLYLHPAPKALLVLMPEHLYNGLKKALPHFQALWSRLTGGLRGELPIVCLAGNGRDPACEDDEARLRIELPRLGITLNSQ